MRHGVTRKRSTKHKKVKQYKLGFIPYKPEQPLQGMELQEKEAQSTKRLNNTGSIFRKNPQLIGIC